MATGFIYSCVHTFAVHHRSSSHQEVETASLLFESVECVACLGQWNAINCGTSEGLKSICALDFPPEALRNHEKARHVCRMMRDPVVLSSQLAKPCKQSRLADGQQSADARMTRAAVCRRTG